MRQMSCSLPTTGAATARGRTLLHGGCRAQRRAAPLAACATASPSPVLEQPSLPARSSLAVEHVAYEGGAFTARGKLLHRDADPDLVYRVLTDYASLSRQVQLGRVEGSRWRRSGRGWAWGACAGPTGSKSCWHVVDPCLRRLV